MGGWGEVGGVGEGRSKKAQDFRLSTQLHDFEHICLIRDASTPIAPYFCKSQEFEHVMG